MRLTTVILIASLMQVSAAGFAQKISLSKSNASLKSIFREIKSQTGYNFIYTDDQMEGAKAVTINVKQVELEQALKEIFKNQQLSYSIDSKTVIIKEKEQPSFLDKVVAYFVNLDVVGRVVNGETGEGLPGATVKVKGSSLIASTDKDGNFFLGDVSKDGVLEISYIGYMTKTMKAEKNVGTIRLEIESSDLQEVTINKGYYTEKKALSTGSVVKITAKEIERSPVNNPILALQGRVAGLVIQETSGKPGSNVTVTIRGKNSLQNGLEPFYLIDGVPYPSQSLGGNNSGANGIVSPFYSISPNDIESIEVLKDADATAIYGSRGANGVIIITTKRGKQGKANFNVSVSTGGSKVARYLDLMNTPDYLQMRHQAFKNDSIAIGPDNYDVNGTWDTTRYTDWQKEFIGGTGRMTTAQASVSGGNKNTQYFFSGYLQKQTTVFPGDDDAKTSSFLFSITNESPNDKFKFRFSTNYVTNLMNVLAGDLTSIALTLSPVAPALYDEKGELNWEHSTWENPLAYTKNLYDFKSYNLISNVTFSYELLPRLELKSSFGMNAMNRDESRTNPSTFYDPSWGIGPEYSAVYSSSGANRSWSAEPQISWRNSVERFGQISILIGGTFQSQEIALQSNRYENFPTNSLLDDPNSAKIVDVESFGKSMYKYVAAFGRINYTLDNKYILNLTGRRDGSSRFGPGKKFAHLGAVGAAWVFSEERLFKRMSFLSLGKLRSSFGITGNDQIGDYQFLDTYRSYPSYNGIVSLVPSRLFNSQYSWETTKKFEVALELAFLNNRVNVSSAYFNNKSSNQLVNYKVAATSGFSSFVRNFPAKIANSGLELELTSKNLNGEFKWTTALNATFPRNELISFPNLESSSYANTYVEGKSLTVMKLFKYSGIDPKTGLYTVEDMNGDGQITFADQQFVTELKSKYYGGINNSFVYKSLSLDIFFQFVNKNAGPYFSVYSFPGTRNNQPKTILNSAWSETGQISDYQRFSTNRGDVNEAYQNYLYSSVAISSASFIRLKNVALSYRFPKKWIGAMDANIYVRGQNLFTATSYRGLDPETASSETLPTLRTVVIGANFSL